VAGDQLRRSLRSRGTRDARDFDVVRLAGRLERGGVVNDFRHSHRLCGHAMDVAADA